MIAANELLSSSSERPLQLQMRGDLIFNRQTYLGRTYWVVKDPLNLKFFRFEDAEFSILRMIDGRTSPAEIKRQFERRHAPQRLALHQLQSLVSRLFQQSLIVSGAANQGRRLDERRARKRRQGYLAAWTNVLCIRFPGVNPDRFLSGFNRQMGWVFSLPMVFFGVLLIVSALALVSLQFDVVLQRLPAFQEFFAGQNWILLVVALGASKILHELGHGLACKRFGGECHELGLMLLVLTPCLYCNVSDSWMIRSKWRRAAIGAAGMYVELVLAAICTFLWWFSNVGLVHYLCLDIMFVCSVSTLLFNANPLLRYDGYFILSDLTEIPNLQQKASTVVRQRLGSRLLGLPAEEDPFIPQRRRPLFFTYAVASIAYRWLIVVSILWFLYKVFEPYGLQIIGQALVALALYGLLLNPILRLVNFLRVPGRMRQVKKLRFAMTSGLLIAASAAALTAPLPHHVSCEFVVQPRNATPVYVAVPGTLKSIHASEGQTVRAGEDLASLDNLEIQLAVVRLQGEREQLAAKLAGLQLRAYTDESALLQIAEVSETLSGLDDRVERRREDLNQLRIHAPRDGVVFAATPVPRAARPEQLETWSGHPLEPKNIGATLRQSTSLCRIGDLDDLEAILAVDESAIQFVKSGQRVTLFPDQLRGRPLTGTIDQVSETDIHVSPASFAETPAPTHSQSSPGASSRNRPTLTYQASLPLDLNGTLVLAGGRGSAKIHTGRRSLGRRLWDSICRTFRFE